MKVHLRGIDAPATPWLWTHTLGHFDLGPEYGHRTSGIPYHTVFFTVGGSGSLHWRERRFVDGPGTLTVLPAGRDPTDWCTAGTRWDFYWLAILGDGAVRWAEQLGHPFPPLAVPLAADRLRRLRGAFEALLVGMRQPEMARTGALQRAALGLYDDLLDAARPPAGPSGASLKGRALLIEVQRYPASDDPGPDRVDQLAERIGVTPEHLSRARRSQVGCAPKEYVLRERMRQAQGLPRSTGLGIAEVGVRAGYPDPYHFSRLFRRRIGATPSAFRRWA